MSILVFLIVLFVLILVHEFGHFVMAKKTGMRVDEFGIGFPPKLFGIKKGETEYTFNALPIGGFVKIYGEDGTDVPSSPVQSEAMDRRSEALAEAGEGGEDGPEESTETTGEGGSDTSRAFANKSKWAQVVVLVAGVTMNALFAWLLFSLALMVGTPQLISEEDASTSSRVLITNVVPHSPASEAGIPPQAEVTELSANGEIIKAERPSELAAFIKENGASELMVTYTLGGDTFEKTVMPETGVVPDDKERLAIGVGFGLVDVVREAPHVALYKGFLTTVTGIKEVTIGISSLIKDALFFEADLSQVAGPVGIVNLVGEASALGFTTLLMFTAFISLNLAVINLLPFPALDGGRLLFVIIEAIKGSPIRPQLAYALNAAGFMLLILLMIAITYNDIARIT